MPATAKLPKAEKTRHDIVRAAKKLFAEKGFRSMTLRNVTREAHVNLAAVNYHFGSKRELKRSCPGLSDEALQYRFFFTISTMIDTITEKGRLENMSGGKLDSANSERMAEQLIHFAVAGFKQSDSCA
jgi:AcrR family transcriptional regulator